MSSKARRWVGVGMGGWVGWGGRGGGGGGMASNSKPDWSWPATRRWLRVKVARWSRRAVKLRAGWSSVVVLVAALASAAWERWAGATGSAASGRFSSVNVKGAQA